MTANTGGYGSADRWQHATALFRIFGEALELEEVRERSVRGSPRSKCQEIMVLEQARTEGWTGASTLEEATEDAVGFACDSATTRQCRDRLSKGRVRYG
jgi:hypothetical protein